MAYKFLETVTNKFLIPFRLIPEAGLTADKFAFSVSIGIVAGLFPVIGATTVLSLLLTMLFRQNLLVVQSVQWMLAFAQVLLIIPFMQFGAFMLNQQIMPISIEHVNLAFQAGFYSGMRTIGIFHLYAILTWTIICIPMGAISYFAFRAVYQKRISRHVV
jgi:uncharacterized protein (DUF2062 family)